MSPSAQTALASIAGNVHRLRLRLGLTQERLAELADLDLRFLQRVERAQTNIGVVALAALADALGVPLARLLRKAAPAPVIKGRPTRKRGRTA